MASALSNPVETGSAVLSGVAVSRDLDAVASRWLQLEVAAVGSPLQSHAFVRSWFDTLGPTIGARPLVLHGDGFLIPLALTRRGPATVARFPGGEHANYNIGFIEPDLLARMTAADAADLWRTLKRLAPEIDVVVAGSLPEEIGGHANPFVTPASLPAAHDGFDFSLEGGFDAVLSRHRGAKKRKTFRSRCRGFEAAGGHRFLVADSPAEARRIVSAFLEQKAVRLREQGLPDVFASEATRAFFQALADRGALVATAIEAGGEIRATLIGLAHGGTLFLQVNSFSMDEYSRFSPGEVLLHHVVEHACASGFQRVDFGIGDARYKRSWADRSVPLRMTVTPLSLVGRAAATVIVARERARAAVVANPRLHALAKKIRGRSGGGEGNARTDGDSDGGDD